MSKGRTQGTGRLFAQELSGDTTGSQIVTDIGAKANSLAEQLWWSEPAFVGIVKAQGVSRIFLFSFPAFDAQSKFTRCVSGLEVVVAPGRLTIKAGRSSYASIKIVQGMFCEYYMLSRKNPALFQKPLNSRVLRNSTKHPFDHLQIFYQSAFNRISKGCTSLASTHRRWLKRPTLCVGPCTFKSSTAFRSLRASSGNGSLRTLAMSKAELLGVKPTTLVSRIGKMGLKKPV